MKDYQDITLSNQHVPLRIAAFILAFAVAVTAFAVGIRNLGRKELGYHRIETLPDEEVPLYASGTAFVYLFDDDSVDIRSAMDEMKNYYSVALKRAYLLLDAEHTYEGYVNLATLNQSIGQEVAVSDELYAVLTDAMARTEAGEGYSLYAGAVYAEWNSILMASDAERFDPLNDPQEAERLSRLGELTGEEDLVRLEIVDAERHILRLDVAEEYLALLAELEIEPVILDLNLLRDAYALDIVTAELEKAGYDNGYLTTDSGLTVSLSRHEGGTYCVYVPNGTDVTPAATLPVTAGSACSQFQSFAFQEGDYGFYTVTAEGKTVYRHPYLPASGVYPQLLTYACVTVDGEDPVEAAYQTVRLYACTDRAALTDCLTAQGEMAMALGLRDGEEKTVYVNESGLKQVTAATEYGFSVEPIPE